MSRPKNARRRPNPPGREPDPGQGATAFAILSVFTSFAFVYHGVSVLSSGQAPRVQAAFAAATLIYGLLNLAVLSAAHAARTGWCITASQVIAVCYLGIFVVDVFADGLKSGLELGGIVLVGLVLWCNWMAVTKVVKQGHRR